MSRKASRSSPSPSVRNIPGCTPHLCGALSLTTCRARAG
jgi:hypothetical protein